MVPRAFDPLLRLPRFRSLLIGAFDVTRCKKTKKRRRKKSRDHKCDYSIIFLFLLLFRKGYDRHRTLHRESS